jgi:N-acylglucosamine-6-phosphate 2-epimerase
MTVLERLAGGLVVSVQAPRGSALDDPRVIAAMARAAQDAGAVGLRIEGEANLRAVLRRVEIPVIGLLKLAPAVDRPYLTATLAAVRAVLAAGAPIVAFDATSRPRSDGSSPEEAITAIHEGGALAWADCAVGADGIRAVAAGAEIVATTLCGYTAETASTALPAFGLVRELAQTGAFTVCEGGVRTPAHVREAFAAGARAVVVGTAITGLEKLVGEFAAATPKGASP